MFHLTQRLLVLGMTLIAPSAFAQYTFVDGSITLSESIYTTELGDLFSISTSASSGSTTTATQLFDPVDDLFRIVLTQPLTSASFTANTLDSVSATGSGVDKTRANRNNALVQIRNLDLNLATNTIYADIYTKDGSFLHQPFLVPGKSSNDLADTFGLIGNPTQISTTRDADGFFHASGTLTHLFLDGAWDGQNPSGTLAILDNGLSLNGVSGGTFNAHAFADVTIDVRFAVPEPSTYALMAAGLVCLSLIARRRNPAPHAHQ